MPAPIPEGFEMVKVNECRECGARYSQGSAAKRMHIHNGGWKTIKELRRKVPSRISYQPGYGPTAAENLPLAWASWFDGEFFLSPTLFDVVAEGLYDVESMPYPEAVALLNETCDEWEEDGWTVERGWASSGNYSAARATKGSAERFIAIELAEEF